MLLGLLARADAYRVPSEIWMGAYVSGKKIGYVTLRVEKSDFDGTDGYKLSSIMHDRLNVLGADLTQHVTNVIYTDKSFRPKYELFTMSSGGRTTEITARFRERTVECIISAGAGLTAKSVPIPKGANLAADPMFIVGDPEATPGKRYELYYFNPLSLAVEELSVTFLRREKVIVDSVGYDALVFKSITPMGEMTVWQEPNGDIVKIDAMMGINMFREPKQQAMSGADGNSQDFAVLTCVKVAKPIVRPRERRKLDLIVRGLQDRPLSDNRQKAVLVKGQNEVTIRYKIEARKFDHTKSKPRPVIVPRLRHYLVASPYVDCDAESISSQAAEIVGGERNAYLACCRIRAWVYGAMKSRADIGVTRAASDVLRSRVGVCRDYAVLFAALARSIGIPTRVAVGLIYTNGAFYYHAWNECYVGEWVPFDSTLPTDFVDATHVKLGEGDATSMFSLARVIGRLSIEIKD